MPDHSSVSQGASRDVCLTIPLCLRVPLLRVERPQLSAKDERKEKEPLLPMADRPNTRQAINVTEPLSNYINVSQHLFY